MKKTLYKICALLMVALVFSVTGCSPDKYDLGQKNVSAESLVEGISFEVTPDASNPNIIYLKSNMKGYSCLWEHPQGRCQDDEVTLNLAFPGTYSVRFGVETRGGYVYGETYEFEVTTTYLGFVNDELWTNLTGGVGSSKTWIPNDYDYGFGVTGELTYADPSRDQVWGNWQQNWDPGKGTTEDGGLFTSSMTFSLNAETGSTITIVNNTADATPEVTGRFNLNTSNHTISFTDCSILHTQSWDVKCSNWATNLRVLSLTENLLQVAVWRDYPNEDPWWIVLNFVSKEFADNFEKVEPDPVLPENWKEDISQSTSTSTTVKWTLSEKTPINWTDLTGALQNAWASATDYPEWAGGPLDAAQWANFSMTLNSKDNTVVFTDSEGAETSGTYELDENGYYTFTGVSVPEVLIGSSGWMKLHADDNGKLRIVKVLKDALGNISGMWLGARTAGKAEYTAYLFEPSAVGGVDKNAALRDILVANPWQLNVNSTATFEYSSEKTFTGICGCYGSNWCWCPEVGTHYAAGQWLKETTATGEDLVFGTMTFKKDGTVEVYQKVYVWSADSTVANDSDRYIIGEGGSNLPPSYCKNVRVESTAYKTFKGTYALDADNSKMVMSIDMLHPWAAHNMSDTWGEIEILSISKDVLALSINRKETVEGVAPWCYLFVPVVAE